MEQIKLEIQEHLDRLVGRPIAMKPAPGVAEQLPVFLGSRFEFFRITLFGRDRYLAVWKGDSRPGPGDLHAHVRQMASELGEEPVLVLPELEHYVRARLLQAQVAFIVPGSQVFIPQSLIDLRQARRGTSDFRAKESDRLSAPAQLMLLHHLLHGSREIRALADWADRLDYSAMSMSRAHAELTDRELAESRKSGRRVNLRFPDPPGDLWRKSQPYLFDPVSERLPVEEIAGEALPKSLSGLSALSRYSDLSPGRIPTCALASADFRLAEAEGRIRRQPLVEEAEFVLEKWKYRPDLLSDDKSIADPLSVYLSMRNDPDERVQGALHDIEAGMGW
ncbi:MAG: hypothetical protein R6W82_10540 [bacterium]